MSFGFKVVRGDGELVGGAGGKVRVRRRVFVDEERT